MFSLAKSNRQWKSANVTQPTEINISERKVAVGFLLVFYTLRSSDPNRSPVIIDFQLGITRPEVEMAFYDATHLER
jgi:hypothetical protein